MTVTQLKNTVLALGAAAGACLSAALGGWDSAMALLCALMALDYLTGVLLAALWKRSDKSQTGALSSVAGFRGLIKKGMILLVVWLGVLLDDALGSDYVRTMAILFFIGNEGLSLLENLGLMGVPWPRFIKDMLEALRRSGDDGEAGAPEYNGKEGKE